MAKKAQNVDPDSIDDMTDEQLDELRASMETEPDGGDEENAAEDGQKTAQGGENADEGAKGDGEDENAASAAERKPEGEEDDQQDGKTEHVPFKRFDYERNRRREVERAAQEERDRWQKRFDELLARTSTPQKADEAEKAPAIPDPDTDPMGAVRWAREQILATQQREQEQNETRSRQQAEREAGERLIAEASQEFAAAEQADPTVRQAYDALRQSFAAEAHAYGMSEQQALQYIQQTEFQHIAYAKQSGRPIDQYVKGLASARGWRPGPSPQEQQENDDANVAAKRQEAQRRSKTLSNGGGSPGVSDTLSAEQILDMSDRDFDALIAKYGSVAGALAAQ